MDQIKTQAKLQPFTPVKSKADEIARLKILYELSMTLSGDPVDVFAHIAQMIGELLDVKVVCLSEVRGDQLYFISVYVQGEIYKDAGQCALSITPCSTVEESKDYRVYDNVMERFPEASFLKDHEAYSYCGFPALNNNNDVVAVTCLLDDRPHDFTEADHDMLRIFGQRIGMEIDRKNNIAEKEKAMKELELHQKNLEQIVIERTQDLESFSYSVSHDLRAPLRHIREYSKILLDEKNEQLDEEGQDFLQRINSASKKMNELIDGLLGLSKVNKTELKTVSVNLSVMVNNIINKYQEAEPSRSVAIDIQDNIQVMADKVLIQIVLENLLSNAWKYTSKTNDARIEFMAQEQDGQLVISVIDNGAGFDLKYIENLFVVFKRLCSDPDFQGAGIGLATAKRVIDHHGGHIWGNCENGKTTFSFTL